MKKEDCFELGYITKTHGLDGEVLFFFDVDDPTQYAGLDSIFLEERSSLVPYFLEYLQVHKDRYIAKFEGIETIEDAQPLVKSALYLPLEMLPKLDQGKGQFYYHEIKGFTVVDTNMGELGIIDYVVSNTPQPIITMQYQGKEVLLPINDQTVHTANHELKTLSVTLPEGLLEVYLEDGSEDDSE